jgi:hypothetical protein
MIRKQKKPFIFELKQFYDIMYEADCFAISDAKYVRRLRPPFEEELPKIEYPFPEDESKNHKIRVARKCAEFVHQNPHISAVICASYSGEMAIFLSQRRLNCRILAITFDERVAKHLQLWHNVIPVLHDPNRKRMILFKKEKLHRRIRFQVVPTLRKVRLQSKKYATYAIQFAIHGGHLRVNDYVVTCFNEHAMEVIQAKENEPALTWST